ncbi:hypothetical protein ON010_g11046 [Phytophthora cinnamomi]|nr:hypothetical protein ON010_g11046 [Phytophthora cinnamomi]
MESCKVRPLQPLYGGHAGHEEGGEVPPAAFPLTVEDQHTTEQAADHLLGWCGRGTKETNWRRRRSGTCATWRQRVASDTTKRQRLWLSVFGATAQIGPAAMLQAMPAPRPGGPSNTCPEAPDELSSRRYGWNRTGRIGGKDFVISLSSSQPGILSRWSFRRRKTGDLQVIQTCTMSICKYARWTLGLLTIKGGRRLVGEGGVCLDSESWGGQPRGSR